MAGRLKATGVRRTTAGALDLVADDGPLVLDPAPGEAVEIPMHADGGPGGPVLKWTLGGVGEDFPMGPFAVDVERHTNGAGGAARPNFVFRIGYNPELTADGPTAPGEEGASMQLVIEAHWEQAGEAGHYEVETYFYGQGYDGARVGTGRMLGWQFNKTTGLATLLAASAALYQWRDPQDDDDPATQGVRMTFHPGDLVLKILGAGGTVELTSPDGLTTQRMGLANGGGSFTFT